MAAARAAGPLWTPLVAPVAPPLSARPAWGQQGVAVRRHKSSMRRSPISIPLILWMTTFLSALRRASFRMVFKGNHSIILTDDGRRRNWFEIAGSFRLPSVVLIYVLSSIAVYGYFESWHAADSVYFSITALTTVGYGDLVPSHPASCIFFSFAILLALVLLATRLSTYLTYLVDKEADEAKARLTRQLRTPFHLADDERDEEILDEEGQRQKIRQRFRGQLSLLVTYLLLASCISKHALGCTSWQALYFSVVTLTTVGFGDLVPQTHGGKWVVSILCLFGVPIFGNTMAKLVALIYGERKRHVKQQLQCLSVPKLLQMRKFAQELDSRKSTVGSERRISKFEFCCFLLVQNDIVDMDDVKAIAKNFGHLDISHDGYLWSKDALAFELQQMLQANPNGEEEKMLPGNAEKLRNSLDAMDLRTAGCIELPELERTLKQNGVRTSEAAVKNFFRKLDLNSDGKISFQEFRALVVRIASQQPPRRQRFPPRRAGATKATKAVTES